MKKIALITNGGTYNNHYIVSHYTRLTKGGGQRRVSAKTPREVFVFTSVESFLAQSFEFLQQLNQVSILAKRSQYGELSSDGFENKFEVTEIIEEFFKNKLGIGNENWLIRMYGAPQFRNDNDCIEDFAFFGC